MTIGIQVAFDAANPEKLAAFWAVALDYILEPPPPGFDNWQEFAEKIGLPEEKRHDYAAVVDSERAKPRLYFQRVPEGKTAKNRVHLDLNVSAGAPDKDEAWRRVTAHQDKLVAAGATVLYEFNEPIGRWIVLEDPEGCPRV